MREKLYDGIPDEIDRFGGIYNDTPCGIKDYNIISCYIGIFYIHAECSTENCGEYHNFTVLVNKMAKVILDSDLALIGDIYLFEEEYLADTPEELAKAFSELVVKYLLRKDEQVEILSEKDFLKIGEI